MPAEDTETRRRRLRYQASYTGMKETDLLLGRFAAQYLDQLDDSQLDDFEALLDAGDSQIYAWVIGNDIVPDAFDTDVYKLIKNFK